MRARISRACIRVFRGMHGIVIDGGGGGGIYAYQGSAIGPFHRVNSNGVAMATSPVSDRTAAGTAQRDISPARLFICETYL